MSQQGASQKLSYRVAAEAQLLAEEKWIIDALTKIRIQRNCLQIERLELENMKAKLLKAISEEQRKTNVLEELQAPEQNKAQTNEPEDFDLSSYLKELDTVCNEEELNLNVSAPVYSNADISYEIEEDEEEEIEDEPDVIVDMNMFMNGQT